MKMKTIMKRKIKNSDVIFATGVFLRRDDSVNGGWVVEGFEDDLFFNGKHVECEEKENGKCIYYIEE